MKRILIGILVFVVYLACVIAAAFALHFSGTRFALFCIVLGLLGGAAIAFTVWYMYKLSGGAAQSGADSVNLDALLRDADRKLRTSRLGVKSLAAAQIIYILGEDNSAKTQTVLQSGLDAELLAGNLYRDGALAPTELANVWLAGSSVIIEAGGALLRQPALWLRLIKATRPGRLGSIFSKNARQPPRAAVLCVSAERLPGPSEAGYNADQIRASAQTMNERLRQLSQTLGISIPVYVLVTKLDTMHRDHFADYVGRLTTEEVKSPLGSLLATVDAGTGLYAERASTLISTRLDELTYALAEFRLDVLSRGGELKTLASAYEFPRDLQKRRGTIVDFLVEVTRPSQLGINPFLRGFFFSGMRALLIEEVSTSAPAQPQSSAPVSDAGATRVFSLPLAGAQQSQLPDVQVRRGTRKVPQWVFLPHLFSKLLLSDKSALDASRASTKVNLLKRTLLACLCSCILIYVVLLTISFFHNLNLAQQISDAAAVPVTAASPTQFASTHDLQALDQLGTLLLQLDSFRKNGAPLMDRWGLYSGDKLYPIACNAYSMKFRSLLLGPTQANILTQLRALLSPPPAGADYTATYKPLKAYLITTANPEKSAAEPAFLAPVLTIAWAGTVAPPSDLTQLAQTQFEIYAALLAEPQSCMATTGGREEGPTVAHAREYLNGFSGFQHVYQSMLAVAGKQTQSLRFNDKFPGSARYIVDSYEVLGAFTKPGFAFMQNAIQHPEPYYSGEEWVLGPQAGSNIDRTTLIAQLQKQYVADYLTTWRTYLNNAHFVNFQNWNDAAGKLSYLDSPSSPILQLFSLISINTGVALPDIASAFQAPQSVVPPTNPGDRFPAPSNQAYVTALMGVEQAVKALTQNPLSANDPAAAAPIIQAAGAAEQAAENLRNSFNPDTEGKMDLVSFNRLEDPIKSVEALAKAAPAAAAGGGAKAFCAVAAPVLAKFPFTPQSTVDASPDEVAQIFSPGQGALAQLAAKMSQLIVPQGSQYVANPATSVPINPGFLSFFNAAEKVQSALFPMGGNQPTLTFSLTEIRTQGVPDAVLNIDGTQISAAGQTATFRWAAQPSSRITITTPENSASKLPSSWSVFHLVLSAPHPSPNRFEYKFQGNGQTDQIIQFEISGPGAELLNPNFMGRLQRCVSAVAKP
jgi:type VI secretion system protein ImpL